MFQRALVATKELLLDTARWLLENNLLADETQVPQRVAKGSTHGKRGRLCLCPACASTTHPPMAQPSCSTHEAQTT